MGKDASTAQVKVYILDAEDEDETDISDLITEASKDYPSVIDKFVHERDQYMSCALLSVASKQRSVVAVVGKAHVNGIKKNWKQPISVKDLTEIPEPVFTVKRVVSSAAIAFAGRAIIRLARRR
ncbi:uncharacterized protein LOC106349903 [Brassica napus]|uniref:uncharacterized protein LOC106349903 n=1 Tax=Brassica napus TaxID=3708 RepID=UPI002078A88E|nr:uncharacterized protein LOC106349903 [Brassica napus]XP_048638396.1 uncharacterized protein LOC106349903 [Brassica napus]